MTALAMRSRKRTIAMFVATLAVIALVPFLGYVGARAVLDSTGGKDALEDNLPIQTFPATPTAVYLTIGGDARLTSVSVFVLNPLGVGGTIISVPVNADVGFADDARQSLQGVYAAGGIDATTDAVESLLRITVDITAEHDPTMASTFLSTLQPLTVSLQRDAEIVIDGDDVTLEAGAIELDGPQAAAVLTGTAPSGREALRRGNVEAVWAAVAVAVGEGRSADGQALDQPPSTFDELVARLFAGPVQSRGLSAQELTDAQNPTSLDVEQVDRSEAVFVFSSIAPGAVTSPAPGLVFRIEAPPGYDAAVKRTIDALLFLGANVVSVDATIEPRPDTVFLVPDAVNRDDAEQANGIFGTVVFEEPTVRIFGVDLTVVLGTDYLSEVEL